MPLYYPLIIYLIAFLTAYLIRLRFKLEFTTARFETIDGLRGFLGLGVFIHHAAVWYRHNTSGVWEGPSSFVLIHFGQTSVTFFFMITGFLFINKLLNQRHSDFDWRAFFISRVFRLAPMYYVSLLCIVLVILFSSNWQWHASPEELISSFVNWIFFTIYNNPLINGYWVVIINAGVEWSLPYEWLFYFSLPLIGLFILRIRPALLYLLLGLAFIIFFYQVHEVVPYYIYAFIGGGIAPLLLKYTSLKNWAKTRYASLLILLCLVLIVQFQTARNPFCILLITLAFTLIAMGNSLFGLLKNANFRFLGDMSYSTYLLHGILLYSTFRLFFTTEVSQTFSLYQYLAIIFCLTPILVLISFVGFKFIEQPFMALGKRLGKMKSAKQ